jgi:hypothetical protein
MAYKETFWMACDSTEQLRAEYGPFHTRLEAEAEARKLGFGYLLRYEHLIGPNEEIEEGPSRFPTFPPNSTHAAPLAANQLRMSTHGKPKCGPTSTSSNTRGTWSGCLSTRWAMG